MVVFRLTRGKGIVKKNLATHLVTIFSVLKREPLKIINQEWEGNIGRPEIQKFVGALQGQRAKKGIFITTSDFNENSYNYVNNIDLKVVLIYGKELANLMIDYNIGVSVKNTFEIKKIDSDYFIED